MIDAFRQIFGLLTPPERRRFFALVGLIAVMAASDVLGVASVLPFLAVVADPTAVERHAMLRIAYDLSGAQTMRDFMILLGIAVFLFVLLTTAVRAFTFYALTYFTKMRTLSLGTRLMHRYLSQPYVWFLRRHSADLGKTILSEVMHVVNGPFQAAMRLLANAVMLVLLVAFLFAMEPVAALGAAALFGGTYGLIFVVARGRLVRMGSGRVDANRQQYQVMQEAMGGIKTVKLMNLEQGYIERFRAPARELARTQAGLQIISELPRQLLEVIAFGGMILFVLWLLATRDGMIADVVPILGLYAFAAARMFPTIQQLFAAVSEIRFGKTALQALYDDLNGPMGPPLTLGADLPPIKLSRELELRNVSFTFPDASGPALNNLSLKIPARSTTGIVGTTGAGKTTAVDLILGLLAPQAGQLVVDGQVIGAGNVRAWQKSVGYVPQDIFLTDDTIAANIAFGQPPERIDMQAVQSAARAAELHDFVCADLPRGYQTMVGDRGVRLSGGQRQRIGIARALYHNPDILIFDEATSALDNLTERAVMQAVRQLGQTKTVVMIAHRLSTVRNCDRIFLLEHGRVVAADRYEALVAGNATFRALHQATA